MTAPSNTTRRGFLKTTMFLLGSLGARASYIKRTSSIHWCAGATLPLPSSPSFSSTKRHVLYALENGLTEFKGQEIAFEFISFLPTNSTVEDLLLHKQSLGEITLGTRFFDGLGSFVQTVNGHSFDLPSSIHWRLEVNGVPSSNKGISQMLIQTGDKVRLVLGSALNDKGIFNDTLGDYSEILFSQHTPMWRGRILTTNDWPQDERGSLRHEFFKVTAPADTYFIPDSISGTKYVERWNSSTDTWMLVSSSSISTSASNFIGKSWNNGETTAFNQPSTKMFYGGTGTGFPPVAGNGSEVERLKAQLAWLRENKVRIRTVIDVTFVQLNGNSSTERCEWITLPSPRPFKEGIQPLQIKPGEIRFEMPGNETGLIEIQATTDMDDWTTLGFTDNPSKVFVIPPDKTRQFARTTRY